MIQQMLAIWFLIPLPLVHVLLKPGLENFEYYFTSMWNECNCAVVWAFFGIAFLWDWDENWPFLTVTLFTPQSALVLILYYIDALAFNHLILLDLHACVLSRFSHVQLFATLWAVTHQASLSLGFSRQEHWSGLPCPPPGDLSYPGIEPAFLTVSWIGRLFFTTGTTWEASNTSNN